MNGEPVPPAATADETRVAATRGKQRARGGWGSLLILVLLLAVAAAGWLVWQQLEMRQVELEQDVAALRADNEAFRADNEQARSEYEAMQQLRASSSDQLDELQQNQQAIRTELEQTLQQELAASEAAAAAQTERLMQIERALAAVDAKFTETQLRVNESEADAGAPLAEAESLLRIAQQRLVLARDVSTAVEVMLAADELLRLVDDPGVLTVRDMLAQEVAALQAAPVIDVAGLFAQLSAQAARVEKFTVASEGAVQEFSVTPAPPEESAVGDWWTGVKQTVGEYFVVTQNTAEVLPQLDESEQFQLRALVQLKIEQAKLALLQREAELYRAALDDALDTARRWLRATDGSFDEFAATLETLRDTPVVADIPATGQALATLQSLYGTSAAPVRADSPTAVSESQQ